MCLGCSSEPNPINLLLYPVRPENQSKYVSFDQWFRMPGVEQGINADWSVIKEPLPELYKRPFCDVQKQKKEGENIITGILNARR